MKYVSYLENGQHKVGVKTEQGITPIPYGLEAIISRNVIPSPQSESINEADITFAPCVPLNGKIVCVGLNYQRHAEEAGQAIPATPILFNKFSNALSGHQSEVELPSAAAQYDYEAELGVVIGKKAKNVNKEEALNYVFGYCNVNDISARDLQMRTGQWMLGKSLDGFCPVGPYLVTADEVGDPNNLDIRCYVNGEIRQNSNTKDMIFKVDEIVSYISQYITLEPGDIILTGTPEGVIFGFPEERRKWLQPGDEVIVEIERLGTLKNRMV